MASQSPEMASEIPGLLDTIAQNGSLIMQNAESMDDVARQKIITAATLLIQQLENPGEILARIGWEEPSRTAALRVAHDLDLFAKLNAETPLTSVQLAENTKADPILIARVMKHLAANGLVKEAGFDQYLATIFSTAATEVGISGGLTYTFGVMSPTFETLPEFLAKTQYQVPTNADDSPVKYGLKSDKPFFGILQENARLGTAFNNFMGSLVHVRPRWVEYYPCDQRLILDASEDTGPLIVDIGGGLGHDLSAFHNKFTNVAGRLVLEDTRTTMAQIASLSPPLPSAIKPMEHDFFTPQPNHLHHARAYFLHFVLHDWTDDDSKVILKHLKDIMKPGYSKLLINEVVMPDVGAPWQHTGLDWTMMAMLVNRERTESQWKALLAAAGFKVTGIWSKSPTSESVIEAVLSDE